MAAIDEARERWSQWHNQRSKALSRDGWICQECGVLVGPRDSPLPSAEVHHHIPVRSGGSDGLTNLQTLCSSCHSAIESTESCVYPTIGKSYRDIVEEHRTPRERAPQLEDIPDVPLNDTDVQIIRELRVGRNIPSNVADEIGKTNQYVRERMLRLEEHGLVRNIGRGVYELVE